MATVTTPLAEKAESIFTTLGYDVSGSGAELRAERKWRTVHVTAMRQPETAPQSGDFRCFVTWQDRVDEIRTHLAGADLDYEWAVIGVEESGEYEVHDPPVRTASA
jgi:hypothetical protein